MDNIYYDGNLKASITVGNVSSGSSNGYTKSEVNELLEGKADNKHVHSYDDLTDKPNIPSIDGLASEEYVNNQINNIPKVDLSDYVTNEQLMEDLNSKAEKEHTHEEYLTEHQDISHLALKSEVPSIEGLATTSYVDNAIDNIDIPEVDLSNCATKEELNEVKQSVSNGKELLASAITDKGVNTSKDDTFQTMANNVSQISTGDGPVYENPDFYEMRTNGGTDYSYLFSECPAIYINNSGIDKWDTSNVTNMDSMFKNCYSLTSLDLSNFNTSNVTNMSSIFYSCGSLTSLDLSNFDTSNVTNMQWMFYNCNKLTSLDLSNFDTSDVTNMSSMFYYCSSLISLDLSNFDTSNVTDMSNIFTGSYGGKCIQRLIIPNWDMTKVKSGSYSKIFGTTASYMTNLNYIDISNTDSSTLTKVKDALFAKTADAPGEIVVPANTSQELIEALKAKYWNPVFLTE